MSTPVTPVVPEISAPITFEMLRKMTSDEYKAILRDPVKNAQVTKLLTDRSQAILDQQEKELSATAQSDVDVVVEAVVPTAEEVAAAEAIEVAKKAEEAEAARKVAEAEQKAIEEKERIAREAAARPTRLVLEYQATDEHDRPIGRLTHLEADTYEELIEKQKKSYIEAVRYAERLKSRLEKVTVAVSEPALSILTDEQRSEVAKEAESTDTAKAELARIKLQLDEASRETDRARKERNFARGQRVSEQFMALHPYDFRPCQANSELMAKYIRDNKLDWTVENLEAAFVVLESQLAPVERVVVEQPVIVAVSAPVPAAPVSQSPPVVNPPVPASVVISTSVEVPTPEVLPVAPPIPAAPVSRKLPASGLEPGSLHGGRPVVKSVGLTKQDVAKMSAEEFRKKLRDPNFRKQLNIIGIKA